MTRRSGKLVKVFTTLINVQQKKNKHIYTLGGALFFLRLPSNAFPDIGSVGRIEKKKPKKKSQEVSEK